MTSRPTLETPRLRLWALDASDMQALIDGAPERVESAIDASFPRPFRVPPLMDDVLEFMRDLIEQRPNDLLARPWFFAETASRQVVGAGGFFGPDESGSLQTGYAIYPEHEHQGFATEAMTTLVQLAWEHPSIRAIRATIPPTNTPSLRVAEKLGMSHVGDGTDPEVGPILVYEILASSATNESAPRIETPSHQDTKE